MGVWPPNLCCVFVFTENAFDICKLYFRALQMIDSSPISCDSLPWRQTVCVVLARWRKINGKGFASVCKDFERKGKVWIEDLVRMKKRFWRLLPAHGAPLTGSPLKWAAVYKEHQDSPDEPWGCGLDMDLAPSLCSCSGRTDPPCICRSTNYFPSQLCWCIDSLGGQGASAPLGSVGRWAHVGKVLQGTPFSPPWGLTPPGTGMLSCGMKLRHRKRCSAHRLSHLCVGVWAALKVDRDVSK